MNEDQLAVQIRHRARIAAGVGFVAAVLTIAWFARALGSGSLLDWLLCLVVAGVGVTQLLVVRDSRAPLMVADDRGVRVRHGETWSGLRWEDIDRVEIEPRASWWHDGQMVLIPLPAAEGEDLPVAADRFVVPLTLTTAASTDDLAGDLDLLADGRTSVLLVERAEAQAAPGQDAEDLEDLENASHADALGDDEELEPAAVVAVPVDLDEDLDEDLRAAPDGAAVEPTRNLRLAARSLVTRDFTPRPAAVPAELPETAAHPVAALNHATAAGSSVLVARLDDLAEDFGDPLGPAGRVEEPVIGPIVLAARRRAGLDIDQLSERTRIRPHVLESIEVDDFTPCGGDFYARGHLRTLARVFGLDAADLLETYDERYAHEPIAARQVFEAELASGIGGGMRAAGAGPRWSLLAGCVLALAAVWGMAQVLSDPPKESLVSPAPGVVDSAGLSSQTTPTQAPKSTLAPMQVRAVGGSSQTVVRDSNGRILWAGKLAAGERQRVVGSAPFEVTAEHAAVVRVSVLGKAKGPVGSSDGAGSKQFG